jgi:hypothetical protein
MSQFSVSKIACRDESSGCKKVSIRHSEREMSQVTRWIGPRSHWYGFCCHGNRSRNCRHPPQRVTSAICADGCATVRSGANNSQTSRGRTNNRRLFNPDFPNLFPTTLATAWRATSPRRRAYLTTRNNRYRRSPAGERSRLRGRRAIATAAVDAVEGAGVLKLQRNCLRKRLRCPLLAAPRARARKPTQH